MDERVDTVQTDAMSADERFACRAAAVLDASMRGVTPAVTARLDSIRASAIASADAGPDSTPVIGKPGDPLPAAVTGRLDAIRARAMQRAAQQSNKRGPSLQVGWRERLSSFSFGAPAGAFASLGVLVTTLALFNLPGSDEPLPAALAENVLLLASVDDIELYENLEFYQWLAENGL